MLMALPTGTATLLSVVDAMLLLLFFASTSAVAHSDAAHLDAHPSLGVPSEASTWPALTPLPGECSGPKRTPTRPLCVISITSDANGNSLRKDGKRRSGSRCVVSEMLGLLRGTAVCLLEWDSGALSCARA